MFILKTRVRSLGQEDSLENVLPLRITNAFLGHGAQREVMKSQHHTVRFPRESRHVGLRSHAPATLVLVPTARGKKVGGLVGVPVSLRGGHRRLDQRGAPSWLQF